jgi:hypothetical protein
MNFCKIQRNFSFLFVKYCECESYVRTIFNKFCEYKPVAVFFLSSFQIIKVLAGSTRRCPGHYIKVIKCIVRAKVARKVSPKVLHLLFNKLCLKMTDHGSRSTWAQVLPDLDYGPKNMLCSH